MRTNLTSGQKTKDIDNEDVAAEMDTEINVAMEMKLGKVSLNNDIHKSWGLLLKLTLDVLQGYSPCDTDGV